MALVLDMLAAKRETNQVFSEPRYLCMFSHQKWLADNHRSGWYLGVPPGPRFRQTSGEMLQMCGESLSEVILAEYH